jgi:SAM-dependent methyltransferase
VRIALLAPRDRCLHTVSDMKRYRAIAHYYDAEYESLPMLQDDVPFFLEQIPRRRQRVLELACGTGRASIPIAQAGHRVTGVDYAQDMLELALHKRDSVGISERQLQLIHADALKLDLAERFDVVCVFFNTFLNFVTLEEQDQLLQVARKHLRPRGRLWIDIFQPNLSILAQRDHEELEPGSFYVPALDRSVSRTTEIRGDQSRQLQKITYHYCWFDESGQPHHQKLKFQLTYLFPRELRLLLERNGFALKQLWGDYDAGPLQHHSPRMISCSVRS